MLLAVKFRLRSAKILCYRDHPPFTGALTSDFTTNIQNPPVLCCLLRFQKPLPRQVQ